MRHASHLVALIAPDNRLTSETVADDVLLGLGASAESDWVPRTLALTVPVRLTFNPFFAAELGDPGATVATLPSLLTRVALAVLTSTP